MAQSGPVVEDNIFDILEKVINHFNLNINNQYLHQVLMTMAVPDDVWSTLEKMGDKFEYYRTQGYSFKDLYGIIYSAALFIHHMKTEVKPNIRPLVTRLVTSAGSNSRVIQTMLINNFASNVAVFSDLVNELYLGVVSLDKERNKKFPVFKKMLELEEIGAYLI